MHVHGQRRRAVSHRQPLLCEDEVAERGAPAAELLGDGEREIAALSQVLVVLGGEGVIAVVSGGALGERVGEPAGQVDDVLLPGCERSPHQIL